MKVGGLTSGITGGGVIIFKQTLRIEEYISIMTDEQLIEQVKKGETEAFSQVLKRYEQKLFWFARRWVGSDFDAKEIVADSMMAVYKSVNNIDTKRSFSSYVYKIVKNFSISFLRKKGKIKEVELDEEILASQDDVWEKLFSKDRREKIIKAINKLKPTQKQVIVMFYFEDRAYEDIAKALEIPVNTIRTLLRRAKLVLRQELAYEVSKAWS